MDKKYPNGTTIDWNQVDTDRVRDWLKDQNGKSFAEVLTKAQTLFKEYGADGWPKMLAINSIPAQDEVKGVLTSQGLAYEPLYEFGYNQPVNFVTVKPRPSNEVSDFRDRYAEFQRVHDTLRQTNEQMANSMSKSDPRWGTKSAWDSTTLLERQRSLETYSAEVAMVFQAVKIIAEKAGGRTYEKEDLFFSANFGSPIVNNSQTISVLLQAPVELKLTLIRELIDGELRWSTDVGYTGNTDLTAVQRLTNVMKYQRNQGGVDLPNRDAPEDKKTRRKIKL